MRHFFVPLNEFLKVFKPISKIFDVVGYLENVVYGIISDTINNVMLKIRETMKKRAI